MVEPTGAALPRTPSQEFGEGASAYLAEDLQAWKATGLQAQAAFKSHDWVKADHLAAECCKLRPDWAKGYELRRLTMTHLGLPGDEVVAMLQSGIARCEAAGSECGQLRKSAAALQEQGLGDAIRQGSEEREPAQGAIKFKSKVKGVKLLPNEQALVESGALEDITHSGSSAIWLSAPSTQPSDDGRLTTVYRPMGDLEYAHLAEHGMLPASQPYQTIVQSDEGRVYAEKYLRGHKSVDSSPTTVVEFLAPRELVRQLFATQSKNEDGAISHGLGDKGGRGLPLFNEKLESGETTWRIVLVKRFERKAVGAFGAGRRKL